MNASSDPHPATPAKPVNIAFFELNPEKPIYRLFPKQPFTNIAIAASGGGFRAAAYLLGTLSYLYHLQFRGEPLLKQVTYIASASGGSLASAFYRHSLHKGQSFGEYFKTTHNFLNGTETLKEVAVLLANDKEWTTGGKRRNLINAFARVYDQKLDGLTLGDIFPDDPAIPVREMCFNTTEFYRGLWFRFQTHQTGLTNTIGNKFLMFKRESIATAKKIKIGDIIAASSCFPAGFEPMRFPEDFSHATLPREELQAAIKSLEPPGEEPQMVGLMDGGIVDNQAIASMLQADLRRSKRPGACFNLAIITDVSNQYIPPFVPKQLTSDGPGWQGKSIANVWKLFQAGLSMGIFISIIGLLLFAACLLMVIFAPQVWMQITGALFVLPMLILSALGFAIDRLFEKARHWPGKLREILVAKAPLLDDHDIWSMLKFFARLPFGTIAGMLTDRIGTVVILASDLFLKRIRRADYQQLYEDHAWRFRLTSNFIYDLSTGNKENRDFQNQKGVKPGEKDWRGNDVDRLTPSTELSDVAEKARLMDTTLWFDKDHQKRLGDVTATGQFTTCYNLIQYLYRLQLQTDTYAQLSDDVKQSIEELRTQLLADWDRFQADPCWLYNQVNRN
ncbi:patatin-like phospholipase family protein [Spirosoma sp. BT702]|uniref:Patatin-like phospholipase family protein n=1 Tax=Spirosoma profusum TaxID=2771354 RepID=A0A926Y2U6_9BACT|nr:patatin-like phospholipase family protein [Spirosoma profusum]MBD2702813.1 patatin-like phospholipase family protein [Spirosoma profusum]